MNAKCNCGKILKPGYIRCSKCEAARRDRVESLRWMADAREKIIEDLECEQGTKSKTPQAIRLLQEVAGRHCSRIQKPYTLKEICEHVDGSEYNAELMLQHLLLWCSDYMKLP